MLFQSPEFFLFFGLFFALYWLLGRWHRLQNLLTLVASYVFYGWWDPRMLLLIAASSAVDFCVAIRIERTQVDSHRRNWLLASLAFNLSILGFFKYYNFFAQELEQLLKLAGLPAPESLRLDIILPVGISFYTFQTLSYSVDVFHRRMSAARDPVLFFTYIAFFPQLVAGPIERAGHLLPQFAAPRVFSYPNAVRCSRLLLWGFFKKLAVADSCAVVVDRVFTAPDTFSGWHLLAGSVAFALQIYGDFSGYSDIARGTAGLLGIDLMENFRFPYFSQSPAEFWKRWHISLSSWFRDYVYIPMGGSRCGVLRSHLNVVLVFLLSGLWHGASRTFVSWGLINGLLVLAISSASSIRGIPVGNANPLRFAAFAKILATFLITCCCWVVFRSNSVSEASHYLLRMAADCSAHPGGILVAFRWYLFREWCTWPAVLLLAVEWLAFRGLWNFDRLPAALRWLVYLVGASLTMWSAFCRDASEFLYFQF